jgi:hypothetical protein
MVNGEINSQYPSSAPSFTPQPPLDMKTFESGLFLGNSALVQGIWGMIISVPFMILVLSCCLGCRFLGGEEDLTSFIE